MWYRRGPEISRAEHAAAPGNNLNAVRFLFAFNIDTTRNYFQRSPFGVKDWCRFYKVFLLYICLFVYNRWYVYQLTLPSALVFQSASLILPCFLCMAQYLVLVHCQYSRVERASGLGCHSRSTSTGEDPFVKVFNAGSCVQCMKEMKDMYYHPSISFYSTYFCIKVCTKFTPWPNFELHNQLSSRVPKSLHQYNMKLHIIWWRCPLLVENAYFTDRWVLFP